MKRNLLVLALLSLLFALTFASVQAQVPGSDGLCRDAAGGVIDCPQDSSGGGGTSGQPGDRDGDGTPDDRDRCPDAGGHADLGGCPDTDGDGTPDIDDRCPTVGGHADNQGCPGEVPPVEDSTDPQPTPAPSGPTSGPNILTALPTEGRCVVATLREEGVNVRATPMLDAPITGVLQVGETYAVLHIWTGPYGGTWYRIANPAGWVFGLVVRVGGDCSDVPTSDFNDAIAAKGAIPHWGPNGELWFCLPNYEIGEETCEPPSTAGAVPNWGPNGELTFCLPNYEIGEDTCVVIPASARPHWPTLDKIVYCLYDEAGREDCFFLNADEADGGIIIRPAADDTGAPPENPIYHKFMLVGEDGLIVLTGPDNDGATEGPNADFPLYFALCDADEDPNCLFQMMMHDEDLPIAACAFNPDAIIQCQVPGSTDGAGLGTGKAILQDIHFMYVPFDPELPIAACAFDRDAIIQCANGATTGQMYDPDLPIAACAFDPDAIIQCGPDFDPRAAFMKLGDIKGEATQTREHVLLARQVNVPVTPEEEGDGGLEIIIGTGDSEIALLLPAVQKVREAAR